MGVEIERKFLVKGDLWKSSARGARYRQGYLNSARERTVRVRTIGEMGYLTVKGIAAGASRIEFEYVIPTADADAMLTDLCEKPLIEKNRYRIRAGEHTWEIDEFFGENRGLVVAEVELAGEEQAVEKPEWIGEEVTGDPRYFNSNLIKHPYTKW
ncbi:MAG: CYTH domain-containing protein [Thermodesulfobacteriota bacterium]